MERTFLLELTSLCQIQRKVYSQHRKLKLLQHHDVKKYFKPAYTKMVLNNINTGLNRMAERWRNIIKT